MSVYYGGPAPGGAGYAPPGKVNFGWINEAFDLFKANAGVWILAVLMMALPAVFGGILGVLYGAVAGNTSSSQPPFGSSPYGRNPFSTDVPPVLEIGTRVVSAVWSAFLYGGIFQMAVKQVRGEPISAGDIFSGGPLLGKMFGFSIIYGFAVVIGTLLCILPGLLLSGLLFPAYALIADGEGVSAALSRSMDAMKRDMWNAALFIFVMGLLVAASYLAFCLGEFVTIPMFWLTSALAYRDMIGMPGGVTGQQYGAAPPQYGMPQQPGVWPPPPGTAQVPPPYAGPAPSFGAPPTPGQPLLNPLNPYAPPAAPPRRSLSGDDFDQQGNSMPPPNPPPAGEDTAQ